MASASSDGKLPNLGIRSTMLDILTIYTDADSIYFDNVEGLLKQSGIGKSVQLLAESDQETPRNRKLAKSLVAKWFALVKQNYEETMAYQSIPAAEEPVAASVESSRSSGPTPMHMVGPSSTGAGKKRSAVTKSVPEERKADGHIKSLNEYTGPFPSGVRALPAAAAFHGCIRRVRG